MDINNPFETCEKSAFRLEGLPEYKVASEIEALKFFKAHGEAPKDFGADWTELVRANLQAGKTMQRLRLLSDPLTEYEKFELQTYPGLAPGEDIRTAKKSDYEHQFDFWFFDNRWIAKVNYEADGTFVGFDIAEAKPDEICMVQEWQEIFEQATPLDIL